MKTAPRIQATIRVHTLTVDTPSNGIDTSVHLSEEAAIAHLHAKFDPTGEFNGALQLFCDNGFGIHLAEHDLEVPLAEAVLAAKRGLGEWRDANRYVCDYRVMDGIANLHRAYTALDHLARGEHTPEWEAAMASFRAFLDTAS